MATVVETSVFEGFLQSATNRIRALAAADKKTRITHILPSSEYIVTYFPSQTVHSVNKNWFYVNGPLFKGFGGDLKSASAFLVFSTFAGILSRVHAEEFKLSKQDENKANQAVATYRNWLLESLGRINKQSTDRLGLNEIAFGETTNFAMLEQVFQTVAIVQSN